MGDLVSQNRAYALEILLAVLEMYELKWQDYRFAIPMVSIYPIMIFLVTCLGGMRGYKVMWTDLGTLRYDMAHCLNGEDESAVAWPIAGRLKAQNGVLDGFMVPITGTKRSGIKLFAWTQRF